MNRPLRSGLNIKPISDHIMIKEIRSGIFQITVESRIPSVKPHVNLYVIAGENGLLFDAGYGLKKDIRLVSRYIEKAAAMHKSSGREFTLSSILPSHSHADHFSGASGLAEKTGAIILLTPEMKKGLVSRKAYRKKYLSGEQRSRKGFKKLISDLVDFLYEKAVGMSFVGNCFKIIAPGDILTINGRDWEVISMPGHSSDHIALFCKSEGILLGGDNILRSVITWLGPPDSDLAEYEATLKKTLELPGLRLILPAHGSRIAMPRQRIMDIMTHRKKRLDDVLRIIETHGPKGASLRQIQDVLYPGKGFMMRFNSEGWIKLVLQDLENSGKIIITKNPEVKKYCSASS